MTGSAARESARRQIALRDGIFAACLLCRRMGRTGEQLAELRARLPASGSVRAELPLESSRGDVMEGLARHWPQGEGAREGLRLRLSGGWAWIRPAAGRPALKIRTEAENVELAAELCDLLRDQVRTLDRRTEEK